MPPSLHSGVASANSTSESSAIRDSKQDAAGAAAAGPAPTNKQHSTSYIGAFTATNVHNSSYEIYVVTLISTVVLTTLTLGAVRIYRRHIRRIPNISNLNAEHFCSNPNVSSSPRSLLGYATSVHDPDNLRFFHTPMGRLAGWDTPLRPIPTTRKGLKDATLSIRIAGIDAPELPHFGKPGQPYGKEALKELRALVEGKRVRVWPIRRDQYARVVALVFVRRGILGTGLGHRNGWIRGLMDEGIFAFWQLDVGAEMLRRGAAGVYEGKVGAEFGGKAREIRYRQLEDQAKRGRVGMWKGLVLSQRETRSTQSTFAELLAWVTRTGRGREEGIIETPGEFKRRMKRTED